MVVLAIIIAVAFASDSDINTDSSTMIDSDSMNQSDQIASVTTIDVPTADVVMPIKVSRPGCEKLIIVMCHHKSPSKLVNLFLG